MTASFVAVTDDQELSLEEMENLNGGIGPLLLLLEKCGGNKQSAKDVVDAINNSLSIVLLIDQKDSSGEEVMFFNKKVKTQTGFLKIARKYNLPIIPIKNRRITNGNIELTFLEPLYHNNLEINDTQMMEEIHNKVEQWIKAEPSQWFWQHKRFS